MLINNQVHCGESCDTKQCFVQKYCSLDWINSIDQNRNQVFYKKGQYLFREGDRVFGLYFIQKGKVKVISTGFNGKEQVVRLATVGHVVGHRGYGNETYPIGALALEDTVACFLDNTVLYDAFMNNPKFTYTLMMFYASELRKTEIRGRHLAQMTIREKVADALLYLKEVFDIDPIDQSLNVIMTRQEIADIAGTNAEQVMRMLTDFENESLVKKEGKKIILLNSKGLSKIIANHNKNVSVNEYSQSID